MKSILRITVLFIATLAIGSTSCDETHGCMDSTADNFDPTVDKEDGSCIPAREKMIGYFDYYSTTIGSWNLNGTPVIDTINSTGWMHITEANTDALDFKANVDGQWVFEGSVKRFDLEMLSQTVMDTMQTNGTGLWYSTEFPEGTDTADMTIRLNFTWSIPNFSYAGTTDYYLRKRN